MKKAIESRYAHYNVEVFAITLDEPAVGAKAHKTNDSLIEMLIRAEPFVRSHAEEMRRQGAERLRNASERWCKELLVKKRIESGDKAALITEYDGKDLGDLQNKVTPYLMDPSHHGILRVIRSNLNPGKHDDKPPSVGALKDALGHLKRFTKEYLGKIA
jgi:hypothetical protein